jgi:hypothetical protein
MYFKLPADFLRIFGGLTFTSDAATETGGLHTERCTKAVVARKQGSRW